MSIKSIDLKFTSANSVPVERAVVTREEWAAVKQMADDLAGHLEGMMNFCSELEMDLYGECKGPDEDAASILAKYKEAKQ